MSHTAYSQSQKLQEIAVKVRSIIDALPHREAIREGDLNHWVEHVVATQQDLAPWHAMRAGGFGGSQIGALVRNFMGHRADHDSAHDIVSGALLRTVPSEPTGPMRRGIAMEAEHRKWFYRRYSATRDDSAFNTLSKSVGPRLWMRYSPDEVATMPNPRSMSELTMQRWLGDYKAPTQVDHAGVVAFQYVCQLHMGRMISIHNGIEIDGMILSQFDWQNWDLKDDIVEFNPALEPLILQAGDHFWAYVERGEVPPYVRKGRLDDAAALVEDISGDAYRLANLKAMGSALEKFEEVLQASVVERASLFRFGNSKLNIDGNISISAVQVFDEDAVRAAIPDEIIDTLPIKKSASGAYSKDLLLARVKQHLAPGEKLNQFLSPGSFESSALYDALVDAGVDADELVKEQLRVTVSDAVKQEARARVERDFSDLISVPQETEDGEDFGCDGEGDARHAPRPVCA